MKKIKSFQFVLVLIVVIMALTMTVFADASITIGKVEFVKGSEDVEFTVPYTSQGVEQITILALKGTKDGPLEDADKNILYVDQQDDQQEAAEGEFIFKINLENFNEETPYVYIKIGGTSIETPYDAGGKQIWSDFVPVLVYGDVNGDGDIDPTDAILIIKYASTLDAGNELDPLDFPDGIFKVGNTDVADVNGDGDIDPTDAILIIKYASTLDAGNELDPLDFPGGKFKADKSE